MARRWVSDSIMLGALGAGGAATANMMGADSWALLMGAGGLVSAAAVGVAGRAAQKRDHLHESLVQALAPLIGKASHVTTKRWKGRPPTPTSIIINYDPLAKDDDPAWLQHVVETVQRRLTTQARIRRHDQRRRMILIEAGLARQEQDPERQRVERTIADLLGQQAKVTECINRGEAVSEVTVRHIPTTKVASSPGYRLKVERTFGTVHQGRWRCKWDLQRDCVTFQLRPEFPEKVVLPNLDVDPAKDVLAAYDKVAIPFGADEDGNALSWRPAIDPNLMVVGAPGRGKTVLEHNVLCSVAQAGWPIWVVDGKAIEFLGWRDWPNVQVVASKVQEQVAVISRAHELMEHRYQLIVAGKASEDDFEPLMLFIDEWSDFRANLLDWYTAVKVKGMPTKPPVLQKVASIARKGRSSRVHLLFATQRPDAEYFGGDMRDNFRARISMGRLSQQGAMMMWQDPAIGTTVPRGCRGRATTINDDDRAIEVQTYFVPDPRKANRRNDQEELAILEGLRPLAGLQRHRRLLIVPPEQDAIDSDGEYNAWCSTEWVIAEARPDLDPLRNVAAGTRQARDLAAPTAMFNLPAPASSSDGVDDDLAEQEEELREFADDYEPAQSSDPLELCIGDLIEIEPGYWVTVDEEPMIDDFDPGAIVVGWRDDQDQTGIHSIGAGETISSRTTRDLDFAA